MDANTRAALRAFALVLGGLLAIALCAALLALI
jgi:hypothetical protein